MVKKATDLEPGFKMTELGPLPEEWEVVTVKDAGKVVTGKTPPTRQKKYWNGTIPFITPAELEGRAVRIVPRTITEDGLKVSKPLPEGTILVSCIGYVGKVGVVASTEAVTNQQINAIIPNNDKVYNWYLAYLFTYSAERLKELAVKTTVPILNKSNFESVEISLPPLLEQQAIAHVLQTVQRAREATEAVIEATKKLKNSLMRHLFTYGPVHLEESANVPLKETEIGLIPEDWEVVRIKDIGEIITGKTPSTKEKKYWGGAIPFITPSELQGAIVRMVLRTVTEEGLSILKPLPRGTVLVSCIGYIGKVGVVGSHVAVTNQQINAVVPDANLADNWFLTYLFVYYSKDLKERASLTTVPILSKSNFESTLIPLPPLPEQKVIAQILQTIDHKIQTEQARKGALDDLFKTLLHNLMTGKIRVIGLDIN